MPTPTPDAPGPSSSDQVLDIGKLAEAIQRCFDLATDGAIAAADQARYLAEGKRLRGYLLNLVSAHWAAGTPVLEAANRALGETDAALGQDLRRIEASAAALQKLADLVVKLDAAMVAVARFV